MQEVSDHEACVPVRTGCSSAVGPDRSDRLRRTEGGAACSWCRLRRRRSDREGRAGQPCRPCRNSQGRHHPRSRRNRRRNGRGSAGSPGVPAARRHGEGDRAARRRKPHLQGGARQLERPGVPRRVLRASRTGGCQAADAARRRYHPRPAARHAAGTSTVARRAPDAPHQPAAPHPRPSRRPGHRRDRRQPRREGGPRERRRHHRRRRHGSRAGRRPVGDDRSVQARRPGEVRGARDRTANPAR